MKTHLLFAGFLCGTGFLSAQITITQNDLAPIYARIIQAQDTAPTVTEGLPGASQTYNLTGLAQHDTDTLLFTLPQFTPYGSNFNNCNFASEVNNGVAYQYFENVTTSLSVVGQAADPFGTGTVALPLQDPELLVVFPSTDSTVFSDIARGYTKFYYGQDPGIGFQVDSVAIRSYITKNSVVDGWGSVTTPFGTYPGLRQNVMRTQYDTVDIYAFGSWVYDFYTQMDSARSFTFWANGLGFPLAELTIDQDLGTVTSASWLPVAVQQAVGISETSAQPLQFYPNPANEMIYISADTRNAAVEITDINGRVISSQTVNNQNTSVDVSFLPNGTYLVRTLDSNKVVLSVAKLVISK